MSERTTASKRLTEYDRDRIRTKMRNIIWRNLYEVQNRFPIKQEDFLEFYWQVQQEPHLRAMAEEVQEKLSMGHNEFCDTNRELYFNVDGLPEDVHYAGLNLTMQGYELVGRRPLRITDAHPMYEAIRQWYMEAQQTKHEAVNASTDASELIGWFNTTGQILRLLPETASIVLTPATITNLKARLKRQSALPYALTTEDAKRELASVDAMIARGLMLGEVDDCRYVSITSYYKER